MVDNSVVDRQTGYKLVIFLNDHGHPHVHIFLNRSPLAKIRLDTGEVYRWWTAHRRERRNCVQALMRQRKRLEAYWKNIHGGQDDEQD